MSDRMLVATRKGLHHARARQRTAGRSPRTDFPGVAGDGRATRSARRHALRRAQARPFRRQAASLRRRRRNLDRAAGAGLPAPTPPAIASLFQVWTLEAGGADEPGRAVGRRHSRPACSARTTAARAGSSSNACGTCPSAPSWFGGGYDDAGIHSISPDPRDAKRVFVAISCGGVWEIADSGATWSAARRGADRGLHAARAGRRARDARTRTASRAAPPRPTRCGCSITTASSARPMPAPPGRSSSRRATISASRSPRIRASRRPRGSCPAIKDERPHAARRRARGDPHARRRQDLGDAARGAAAARRLRPGLPARPRRRRGRQAARHGLDHRRAVGERQTAARAGSSSMRICRRSTRCGSCRQANKSVEGLQSKTGAAWPPFDAANCQSGKA